MPALPPVHPAWIVAAFAVGFALRLGVESGLAVLNLRHAARHGAAVPPALQGRMDAAQAVRSRDYTLAKGRFGLVQELTGAALVLVLLFSGVLPWLDARLAALGLAGAHRFVAFLVVLAGATGLAGLPFRLYGTFGIETRFGFNRQTFGGWLVDRLRGLGVAAVLGLPLLYAVYGFMAFTGAAWWLWLFCFLTAYQLALVWLYPTVIAPLFNRFDPLPPGDLKTQAEALTERAGFRNRGLFVMDASRRSGHSNAYFVGFWRPRIVLFDTLLEGMPLPQALAVLAHEIGHYRAHHVHKALALNLAGSFVLLFVLSGLVDWPPLFAAFGFPAPSYHAALTLVLLAGGAFTFWLQPLMAWFSRRNEYQADAYAVRLTGRADAMGDALVALGEGNLSNLAPHPWYSRYYYSHPTLLERLAALEGSGTGPAKGAGRDAPHTHPAGGAGDSPVVD